MAICDRTLHFEEYVSEKVLEHIENVCIIILFLLRIILLLYQPNIELLPSFILQNISL